MEKVVYSCELRNPPRRIAITKARKPIYPKIYVDLKRRTVVCKDTPKAVTSDWVIHQNVGKYKLVILVNDHYEPLVRVRSEDVFSTIENTISSRKSKHLLSLADKDYNLIIMNKRTAGTEKYVTINNNILTSQAGGFFMRDKIVRHMKQYLLENLRNVDYLSRLKDNEIIFPVQVRLTLYDDLLNLSGSTTWDVDNRLVPWTKVAQDILKELIGCNDTHDKFNGCHYKFVPIDLTLYTEPTLKVELIAADDLLSNYYSKVFKSE